MLRKFAWIYRKQSGRYLSRFWATVTRRKRARRHHGRQPGEGHGWGFFDLSDFKGLIIFEGLTTSWGRDSSDCGTGRVNALDENSRRRARLRHKLHDPPMGFCGVFAFSNRHNPFRWPRWTTNRGACLWLPQVASGLACRRYARRKVRPQCESLDTFIFVLRDWDRPALGRFRQMLLREIRRKGEAGGAGLPRSHCLLFPPIECRDAWHTN